MYKTCFIILGLSLTCLGMPQIFRFKRSRWGSGLTKRTVDTQDEMLTLLINEVYVYLGKNANSPITANDIADFFKNVIGKDPTMSDNFGSDYIFWGDDNGDHVLTRQELKKAMKIHNIFQYI